MGSFETRLLLPCLLLDCLSGASCNVVGSFSSSPGQGRNEVSDQEQAIPWQTYDQAILLADRSVSSHPSNNLIPAGILTANLGDLIQGHTGQLCLHLGPTESVEVINVYCGCNLVKGVCL